MKLTPAQLVEARNYLGMTQSALADALGVGRVNVARYESGARQAPESFCKALTELCEAKVRQAAPVDVAPVDVAPMAFLAPDVGSPGGFRALAKNADEIARLPERDFESLRTRINEVIAKTYDERLKVRGLDILAKLELARAKVALPADAPEKTADEAYDLSRLTDIEFAVFHYLDSKARGTAQNSDLPWVKQAVAVLTSLGIEP